MTAVLGDHDPATLILSAGRAHAVERFPYLAMSLFSMMPVRSPGFGTFGVDKRWRVYWDPEFVLNPSGKPGDAPMTYQECAAVWVHEVGHVLRMHAQRFESTMDSRDYQSLFNQAGDGCINDDLKASGMTLPIPELCIYSTSHKGWEAGMTTEQMYKILKDRYAKDNKCPSCEQTFTDDKQGQTGGSDAGKSKDEKEGQESRPRDGSGTGQGSQPGQGSGHGHRSGEPCSARGPGRQHSDCGSGAGGSHRDWELPAVGNDEDGSVDEGRGRMIREQTARAIVSHAKSRGTVPPGMLRAADEILNPTVDWRKHLTTVARRAIASQAGRRDYSYSRPSRRSSGIGGGVVLPAMRQPPPPNVSIVIDTSGSVSDRMLGQALREVKDIIERAVGHSKPVRIVNCDAKSTLPKSVRNIRNFQLVGGGGTDMRVGMNDAANDRPRPDLVLVFTDGYTPWPVEPPEGAPYAKYVAVLLDAAGVRDVPHWMAKIVIEDLD